MKKWILRTLFLIILDIFKFKGLNIGWDIYESYLRRFYKSTLNIQDKKFHKLFYEALKIYLFWENYLKKKQRKIYYVKSSYVYRNKYFE